jgi:hypothetical protein
MKVPPGHTLALREALRVACGDASRRHMLGIASWQAGQKLPRWTDTARIIADVLKDVAR